MAELELDGVTKRFGDTPAVSAVDLRIADGEFFVLVGPSGCGKTTLLRLISGLETITEGVLRIDGRVANDLEPRARDVAMVFQNYALYPHMSVEGNIGFSLKLAGVPRNEARERVRRTADLLELTDLLDRRPAQLSGGQQQRVAMGRAIVREPGLLLLDEPLSNLDAGLRERLRGELRALQRRLRMTTVLVTHDQTEAMTLGDRIGVLAAGELQQVATPEALYRAPANLFVARFIGNPAMNLFGASLQPGARAALTLHDGQTIVLSDPLRTRLAGAAQLERRELIVGLRPEHVESEAFARPDQQGRLRVRLERVERIGSDKLAYFELDAIAIGVGDDAPGLEVSGNSQLVGRFDERNELVAGEELVVAFDVDRLHLFDAGTGIALTN